MAINTNKQTKKKKWKYKLNWTNTNVQFNHRALNFKLTGDVIFNRCQCETNNLRAVLEINTVTFTNIDSSEVQQKYDPSDDGQSIDHHFWWKSGWKCSQKNLKIYSLITSLIFLFLFRIIFALHNFQFNLWKLTSFTTHHHIPIQCTTFLPVFYLNF